METHEERLEKTTEPDFTKTPNYASVTGTSHYIQLINICNFYFETRALLFMEYFYICVVVFFL